MNIKYEALLSSFQALTAPLILYLLFKLYNISVAILMMNHDHQVEDHSLLLDFDFSKLQLVGKLTKVHNL